MAVRQFLYALRREVLRNPVPDKCPEVGVQGFYTPFGVRCFGTLLLLFPFYVAAVFLYALRREVLRNLM